MHNNDRPNVTSIAIKISDMDRQYEVGSSAPSFNKLSAESFITDAVFESYFVDRLSAVSL